MIYTAVFQDTKGEFSFEAHIASHDRTKAWHEIHEKRDNKETCLVLLIAGQADVNTFRDVVDIPW